MHKPTDSTSDWELIQAHLPPGWRELAREMKLIRELPEHMGTRIRDIGDVLRLVLYQAGASASLRATTALGVATTGIVLSAVALHKWMRRLPGYLTVLLARMVDVAAFAPEAWGGLHVIVGDATTVQRPGSKGTTARVHYALRLADMTARHIEVTDEHGGETARRFRAEPGEVWLLDRVYANPPGVAAIRRSGAHILVRYNRGALPLYDKKGKRIDIMDVLRATSERAKVCQLRAFVHVDDGAVIAGRLCWVRLPEEKAEAARNRAKREADGPCDAETLEAAEFVAVFTTVLEELTAGQVLELYRARWQVELEFKRAKSIRELDRLPNFLPETIHSWICAKLILQVIATRIAAPPGAFPPEPFEPRNAASLVILPSATTQQPDPRRRRRALVRRGSRLEGPVQRPAPRPTA